MPPGVYAATGRRKEAIARVRLEEGKKEFQINDRSLEDYFPRESLRMIINEPLRITNSGDRFGVRATVSGGGPSGQAGAIRLAIARALLVMNEGLRSQLRKAGLLTRDPRAKERKKYGHKGARRSFQYTKR